MLPMPVLLTIILLFSAHSGWTCPYDLATIPVDVKGHRLTVELATTPATKSCGLSHRASLPANRGMLFVYPEPEILTFWMKDTSMPLDIAFIDAAGRIVSIQQMDPFPITTVYSSPAPVHYALEVNRGWFKANDVGIGDVVSFDFSSGLQIR
ncbi:MAG: DUF192 domain-containing protein [Desulfobacterales bacterium]